MKPPIPQKKQRCAIYTRKSTEHNLDLAFNSLDAQREACEAYIKSQAHEGWSLVPGHFDDGAFSGASLDRPALQALLDLVRAKKVDVIVVYKVDRLTRSLADFAKLVELFDAHEVSFVSVTQSFNTTSSMGRLTLNVLLSFAQFEREVIGERVRDKIAASKRKGIWVGGMVPLGYRSVNKKLQVAPDDAAFVRKIFVDYLTHGSVAKLAVALDQEGLKPRPRLLANGKRRAAKRFYVGPLAHLLRNRFYIGEIVYRGEVHRGEHEPIIDRALFKAVQEKLEEGRARRRSDRMASRAVLAGLIFDDRGNPMTPTHANKKGVRYRYYVSNVLLQGRKDLAGSIARVSAPDVEAIVCKAIREKLEQERPDPPAPEPAAIDTGVPDLDCELARKYAPRIEVRKDRLVIRLKAQAINSADGGDRLDQEGAEPGSETATSDEHGPSMSESDALVLEVPFAPALLPRKGIAHAPSAPKTLDAKTRDALLHAIARSRAWIDAIMSGESGSFEAIAANEELAARHVRFLAPLAFVSPDLVKALLEDAAPGDLTLTGLARSLPHCWEEQGRRLGIG